MKILSIDGNSFQHHKLLLIAQNPNAAGCKNRQLRIICSQLQFIFKPKFIRESCGWSTDLTDETKFNISKDAEVLLIMMDNVQHELELNLDVDSLVKSLFISFSNASYCEFSFPIIFINKMDDFSHNSSFTIDQSNQDSLKQKKKSRDAEKKKIQEEKKSKEEQRKSQKRTKGQTSSDTADEPSPSRKKSKSKVQTTSSSKKPKKSKK